MTGKQKCSRPPKQVNERGREEWKKGQNKLSKRERERRVHFGVRYNYEVLSLKTSVVVVVVAVVVKGEERCYFL